MIPATGPKVSSIITSMAVVSWDVGRLTMIDVDENVRADEGGALLCVGKVGVGDEELSSRGDWCQVTRKQ